MHATEDLETESFTHEPPILLDEIRTAIKQLKNNKSPGLDRVTAEMLKAGGVVIQKWLKHLCDKVWSTGAWPSEWQITEMITLPKVCGTRDCTKHRTISLISHASKVLLSILQRRLAHFIHPEISEEQFGFMPGRVTAEAILTFRNVIEKVVKRQQQELWILFIDYTKAFDTVDHAVMWKALSWERHNT